MLKNKLNRRTVFGFSVSCLLLFLYFFSLTTIVRADGLYVDPVNDLVCFTEDQLSEFEEMYDDPESAEDLFEILVDIWAQGEISATPDCIDMTYIAISEVGGNYVLTIYVQGAITDCDRIAIYMWGNCSGGSFTVLGLIETGAEGVSGQYWFRDSDGNEATGSISMGTTSFSMTFPKTQDDCSLNILLINENCGDVFPNSLLGQGSSSTSYTTGVDSDSGDECTTCGDSLDVNHMVVMFLSYFILIAIVLFVLYIASRK